MQNMERRTAVYEYRDLNKDRADLPNGSVVVIFHEGDVDDLERQMDRCRSRFGGVGLLVVVPPGTAPPGGIERIARGLDGPWDLIRPDATVDEWRMRTDRLVSHARQLGELEELRYRASHDDRTGLLRPAEFERRFAEAFSGARRHGHDLTLLLLDLDRFGAVNKEFDHTVGDEIIARVGETVRGALRAEDVAGRLGGDEFAILLPYTDARRSTRFVARLQRELGKVTVSARGGASAVGVSASIGIETFPASDLATLSGLRGHAELALRAAKRAGGGLAIAYADLANASGLDRTASSTGSTLVGEAR